MKIKKSFYLLVFLIVFNSCNSVSDDGLKDTYSIINLVYNETIYYYKVVPPPPEDHIISNETDRKMTEFRNRKIVIAVNQELKKIKDKDITIKNCYEFVDLLDHLKFKAKEMYMDLSKIETEHKIIPFNPKMIKENRKDFIDMGFDYLLQFSSIAFNDERNRAAILVSSSSSTLAGASMIYFLSKVDGKWVVKCEEGLEIS